MKTVNVQTKQDNTATLLDVGRPWTDLMTAMPQLAVVPMLPTYTPTEIKVDNTHYILHQPLLCSVEYDMDEYFIYYDPLDLVATGTTIDQAKESFNEDFDYVYQHFNELGHDKLGNRLQEIRIAINKLVKNVNYGEEKI